MNFVPPTVPLWSSVYPILSSCFMNVQVIELGYMCFNALLGNGHHEIDVQIERVAAPNGTGVVAAVVITSFILAMLCPNQLLHHIHTLNSLALTTISLLETIAPISMHKFIGKQREKILHR